MGRDVEMKRFDQQLRQLEEVAKSQAFTRKEEEREMELGEPEAQVLRAQR